MHDTERGSSVAEIEPTLSFASSLPADSMPESVDRARVAIVSGEGDSLSAQERETLRTRLRAAAVVILFGFGIYLIRSYVDERPLQGFHTFVVVALTGFIAVLVSRTELTSTHLRWLELGIFGVPMLFFVPYHYFCVVQQMQDENAVGIVAIYKNVSAYWFCLLVIYGLFIPNRWRRALVAVAPMVALRVLTGFFAAYRHSLIAQHLSVSEIVDTAMILTVGALCSVYGAEVIGSLRNEAREARSFGQYRLLEQIGRGGMGEVYRAEHQLLKRPCAIKLIRPEHAGDPAALGRFEREVRTTAKLTHWNTIDIYDYGRTSDGAFYYVMEYLPGMNIKQMMKRTGPMSPARAVHLLCQICDALTEAHAAGLIHRDINTGNIFVTERGGVFDVAKLLDFGLVKVAGSSGDETQFTRLGVVSGTPRFMSPEQASADKKPDLRADIYSLGAVAYVMLTGRAPFDGESAMDIIIAHARDNAPPMNDAGVVVPPDLEAVVMRCLEKDPEDRFQSAMQLREALQKCRLDDTWSSADAFKWWRRVEATLQREPSDSPQAVETAN